MARVAKPKDPLHSTTNVWDASYFMAALGKSAAVSLFIVVVHCSPKVVQICLAFRFCEWSSTLVSMWVFIEVPTFSAMALLKH